MNNPYFKDSQRFALDRLGGNVIGIGVGMEVAAVGAATIRGAGTAEFASLGLATPVAIPVAAVGVMEVGGGLFMMGNGGYRFVDNIRRFPDGGGGGGVGGGAGAAGGFNAADYVGTQAVTPPHLPAGPSYAALIIDGKVYVARHHLDAWAMAGKKGVEQFYGFAEIDAAGRVVRLFK